MRKQRSEEETGDARGKTTESERQVDEVYVGGSRGEDMQSSELNSFLRRLTRSLDVPDRSPRCYTYHCCFRTSVLPQIINLGAGVRRWLC